MDKEFSWRPILWQRKSKWKGNAASIHIFDQMLAVSSFFSFYLICDLWMKPRKWTKFTASRLSGLIHPQDRSRCTHIAGQLTSLYFNLLRVVQQWVLAHREWKKRPRPLPCSHNYFDMWAWRDVSYFILCVRAVTQHCWMYSNWTHNNYLSISISLWHVRPVNDCTLSRMLRADLSDLLSTCWIHRLMVVNLFLIQHVWTGSDLTSAWPFSFLCIILTNYKLLVIYLLICGLVSIITKKYRNGDTATR